MRLFTICFLLFGGAEGSGVPWFNQWKTKGRDAGGTVLDRPVHRAWKGVAAAAAVAFPSLPAAIGRVDSADVAVVGKAHALRGFNKRRKRRHDAVYNEADPSLLFGRHVGDAGAMGINAAAHAAAGQG
jgi:hypothetical protein